VGAWLVSSTSGGPGRGGRCAQNTKCRLSGGSQGVRRLGAGAGSQAGESMSGGPMGGRGGGGGAGGAGGGGGWEPRGKGGGWARRAPSPPPPPSQPSAAEPSST